MAVSKKGYLEAAHKLAFQIVRGSMQAWSTTQADITDIPLVSVGHRIQATQGIEIIITLNSHISDRNKSHIRHTYNFTAHHFSKDYARSASMADHSHENIMDIYGSLPSPDSGKGYSTEVKSMFMYYTDEDDYNSQVEFSITIIDD